MLHVDGLCSYNISRMKVAGEQLTFWWASLCVAAISGEACYVDIGPMSVLEWSALCAVMRPSLDSGMLTPMVRGVLSVRCRGFGSSTYYIVCVVHV